MKINVELVRDMFGKSAKQYKATFGQWSAKGATKEEAKQNLIQDMEWFFSEFDFTTKHEFVHGNVIILERSFDGFSIKRINETNKFNGVTYIPRMTIIEALKCLDNHVLHYQEVLEPIEKNAV